MPLFEYQCSKCNHIEELLQKHNETAPCVCPKCQAESSMSKIISNSTFQLKGGCWAKDLYASKSNKK